MSEAQRGGDAVSRLARAAEQFSVLANELAIAVAADERLSVEAGRPSSHAAVAEILQSVSARLTEQSFDLTETALVVAEDLIAASGDERAERSAAALGRASRVMEPVFEIAAELAAHLLTCYRSARYVPRSFVSGDLVALDEPIRRLLHDSHALVTGAGVALSPGMLADRQLWLQWWTLAGGLSSRLNPQLDPKKPDYYDYTQAIWFAEPARRLSPSIAPPHYDKGGTDAYMVTATVPVVAGEHLVGLACAELTLDRAGALLEPALRALAAPAVFLTSDLWVVASSHPQLRPGSSADSHYYGDALLAAREAFAEPIPGVTVAKSPALAWALVVDWR